LLPHGESAQGLAHETGVDRDRWCTAHGEALKKFGKFCNFKTVCAMVAQEVFV
jgi:hypothetical protein